jgi:hypothetical protein
VKVLLARPHDFVVTEMSAALRALGVEPVTLERLDQLAGLRSVEFCGAVICLAASSSIGHSVSEVHAAVRRTWANKPLVLTGLSSLESTRRGLEAALGGKTFSVFGPAEPSPHLPTAFLYLQKTELELQRERALTALRQHLMLGSSTRLNAVS